MLSLPSQTEEGAADDLCGPEPTELVTTVLHQFADSLGSAIDAKDPHTFMHSVEVAEVSHVLALIMGLSPRKADIIHVAGHLHDIGKIGVPDAVLQKRGKLDADEWRAMCAHPELGANILKPVTALRDLGIVDMVLHHHERYDGGGYPTGLKGASIPLGARIITLADSLSAMLQNRPYRSAMTFSKAYDEIVRCSGSQFDPRVVDAFVEAVEPIQGMVVSLATKEQAA